MALSRRSFLTSVAAVVVAPILPAPSAATTIIGVDLASAPSISTTMWICGPGTGEYDWYPFDAPSAEDAWRQWRAFCIREGRDDELGTFEADQVQRVPGFDGLRPDSVRAADWIANGLGACCDRCDNEIFSGDGRVIGDCEAVCGDCLTLAERAEIDADGVVNDLVCDILDDGAEATRVALVANGDWESLPPEIWARALDDAAKEAAAP